jgi:RimJ/RimL family protein N-acetyltransferase
MNSEGPSDRIRRDEQPSQVHIPVAQTARLSLRGFTPDDLQPLHAIVSNPQVLRYLPRTSPWPLDVVQRWMDSQRQHWDRYGFGWFALEHRGTNRLIGWCGLRVLDETDEVEVLYLLDQAYWGEGLATEAARWCIEDGFRNHNLDLIIGLTLPLNVASQRVLEKAGLAFSNHATYFGIDCLRYTIDRQRFVDSGETVGDVALPRPAIETAASDQEKTDVHQRSRDNV